MGHTASDILALTKRKCDEDLQRLIAHVTAFLDNVLTNHDCALEIEDRLYLPATDLVTAAIDIDRKVDLRRIPKPAADYFQSFISLDTSKLVLCDILSIATAILAMPVESFSTQPTACQYFVKRIRDIGKTWEINPQWSGQKYYFHMLLAVSRFSRAVKWYWQAERYPERCLGSDDAESWSFFLSKSSSLDSKDPNDEIHGPRKPISLKSVAGDANAPESVKDFEIIRTLHRGGSKSVFLAKRISTSESFAVKVLEKADMFAKNETTIIRAKCTAILNQADSKFVGKIHFAFHSKTKVYLVKELLSQGDCGALIRSLGQIPEDTTRDYIFQIVHGLDYLHQQGIIHRDLCPENVLIDQAHCLKLTDFGLSQEAFLNRNIGTSSGQLTGHFARSVHYLTPEAVLGLQEDDIGIDWWAVGIITYEFIYGVTPFQAEALELVFQKILLGRIDWNWSSTFVPSVVARDFIRSLLDADSAIARYKSRGGEGVKAHSFFDNVCRNTSIAGYTADYATSSSPPVAMSHRPVDYVLKKPNTPNIGLSTVPRQTLSDRFPAKSGVLKRPMPLTLTHRRSSQESHIDISPSSRRRSSSGRSTPSSAGPGLRRRTSSRNSSDDRGSAWLSGYTTADSDPESEASSYVSPLPSTHSQIEFDVPSYDLPSHQTLLNDLARSNFLVVSV
ncbi:kinase-like domain-containing protein [Mycena albidolilacea]|uniref:non-specific serine/threonine protein kinase n=1 Tax=Mycena albidolilacea TaxID=1033008 RepID=A0AAD7E993_9AGAR|nr:kinase-like domain-containing protein [Mycena albidolilacea]